MKVVMATPHVLFPADNYASILILMHLEVLASKHDVTVVSVASTPEEIERAKEYSRYGDYEVVTAPHSKSVLHKMLYRASYTLQSAVKKYPITAFYGCPAEYARKVRRIAEAQQADMVIYNFWYAGLAGMQSADYSRVLFELDVEYVRRRRAFETHPSPSLEKLWKTTERAERQVLCAMDSVLTVTDNDRKIVEGVGAKKVVTLPSAFDTEKCSPPETEPETPSIIFVGGFGHHPNIDAVLWFANEIFPKVREKVPDATFTVVGGGAPPEIEALGDREGITLAGFVPDVAEYIRKARVSVAPLRIGSGIKGKILEAMAFGRPVVTTTVGAEGIDAVHGESIMVADNAEEYARHTTNLLANTEFARKVGGEARKVAVEKYSFGRAKDRILEIYESQV